MAKTAAEIGRAIKLADSADPADVLAAMPDVDFEGVSGQIRFGDEGDAIWDHVVIKAANTQELGWDFVKVQSVE